MAASRLEPMVRHLQKTIRHRGESDGQLLTAFIESRDDAAFEALVDRHGAMVLAVCKRILGNPHDAEDSFQACWLVLARKATTVRPRDKVGNWLYGVAHRTALRAKAANAKRRWREKQTADTARLSPSPSDGAELHEVLDQELARLPDKYRAVVILCDLEGRPRQAVARQLNIPEGTVSSRLTTARKMLARRLARFMVSTSALTALLTQSASAAVPVALRSSTVQAATGRGMVASRVADLMEGVMTAMLCSRLKTATALVTLAFVLFAGIALWTVDTNGQETKAHTQARPSPARTDDIEALQGVWRVVSWTAGDGITAGGIGFFMIRGNRACWNTRDDGQIEGGFYVDSTSVPKAFDFVYGIHTFQGIYALRGDQLQLCYEVGDEGRRPVEFSAPKDSRRTLIILRREKGMDISDYRRPDGSRTFPDLIERPAPTAAPMRPSDAALAAPPRTAQTPPAVAQTPGYAIQERPGARIGQVIIVGNETIPDADIRKHIPVYPGEVLRYPQLREAEKKLANLNLFVVDPAAGIRPTITVLDDPTATSAYRDILVNVVEIASGRDTDTLRKALDELRKDLNRLQDELPRIQDAATKKTLRLKLLEVQEKLQGLIPMPAGPKSTAENAAVQEPASGRLLLRDSVVPASDAETRRRLAQVQAAQAECDLNIADFYRRAGHVEAALFYYEVVCRKHPNTGHAATARQRIDELGVRRRAE